MDDSTMTPEQAPRKTIQQRVAGVMLLHNRIWAETTDESLNVRCECGFNATLEDIDNLEFATISHRTSMIAETVTGMMAEAWDQGWLNQDESPKVAGIFLNPYRATKWYFDANRGSEPVS